MNYKFSEKTAFRPPSQNDSTKAFKYPLPLKISIYIPLIALCVFCDTDPLINYKISYRTLERKYFEAFNFYFAKPVNEILANVSSAHVILFKDYLFYDDENNEYLKRYYKADEIKPRVKALSDFYQNSYKPTHPNLCVIESNRIINKRNQKINKLFLNKNGNLVKNSEELRFNNEENNEENYILENILTENYEKDEENNSHLPMSYKYQEEQKDHDILQLINEKEPENCDKISYDSSEHDIYNPEFSQTDPFPKETDQFFKLKTSEKPMISLNKIKTRPVFAKKDVNDTPKQNYEILLEEIINKQKRNTENSPDPFKNSFKMNNNILKDFSENRISDISELLNLHELIRNSQKISSQSSAIKQKESIKEKLPREIPHIKKKDVSSQLTQESTKRTTGNTTNASQNPLKNPEKFNKKIHISHNTLFSQINKFHNKTGNVDQIFELIKKMQKEEEKAVICDKNRNYNRNCSTKSNKDLLGNNPARFLGSQTDRIPDQKDRIPDKKHEQFLIKPKKNVKKLNLNLLNEKKNKEKNTIKQLSPSMSRNSNKKTIENTRKPPKKICDIRNKPNKVSFRSLNSNLYSSLRNRSNISSKSHIDTQRSSELLGFKSQEQLMNKKPGIQHKSQLENLEENESSYGFWTSRSNKANIEEKRRKSPEIGRKIEEQKEREDYYNYGLKEKIGKNKAKTDRFVGEKEGVLERNGGNNKKVMVKRNFKLNLPVNLKF